MSLSREIEQTLLTLELDDYRAQGHISIAIIAQALLGIKSVVDLQTISLVEVHQELHVILLRFGVAFLCDRLQECTKITLSYDGRDLGVKIAFFRICLSTFSNKSALPRGVVVVVFL